ncbi:hypothetical protein D9M71_680470 [compost metagenome]
MNAWVRQANANARKANCPQAAGRARLIHRLSPRQAPSNGTVAWTAAKQIARIIANWPSSGMISAAFMAWLLHRWQPGRFP